MKQNLFNKLWLRVGMIVAIMTTALSGTVWAATTYEQLTSIANIDESAQYVLGIDGTGFHYEGTSSWGKTALPSAQAPIYYTLTKASDGNSFTAKATISGTTYYLQIPTSNTFSMATSTGTNTDIIIGTTQVSGTNYAVANKTTTARHLRINGTSGLRSYAGTTGSMAFFYKVVEEVSAYTITAQSNNTDYGTVSLTGTTITATPASGYRVSTTSPYVVNSGTATVTQNGNTFEVTASSNCTITINFEAIPTVSGYTIDFENDVDAYVDWEFENIGTSNTAITAHGGSKYGANINDSGNGTATASIQTKEKVAYPNVFTCYVSKVSNNTTTSNWVVEVSSDGSDWTEVATQDAKSMNKGEWVEFTADIKAAGHTNVYVRLYYNGSTAVRTVDDISLTTYTPAAVEEPSINVPEEFTFSTTATITCVTEGATIYYSYDNTTWTEYTEALTITETKTIYAKAVKGSDVSAVVSATTTKVLATPNVTISAASFNVGETATVTTDGPAVTLTTSDAAIASVSGTTVTGVAAGTATITATWAATADYSAGTKEFVVTVTDPNAPGSVNNPYTVAQALAVIDGLENGAKTDNEVYVAGTITQIDEVETTQYHNATYWISNDGGTTKLEVFRGKYVNNANFTSSDQIKVNDQVVVYGKLQKYVKDEVVTPEVAQGNYIYSLQRPAGAPTVTIGTQTNVASVEMWYFDTDVVDIESGDEVEEGVEVFVEPTANDGYEIESVTVVDANNNSVTVAENSGNWSFVMPNSSVTVNITAVQGSVTPVTGDKYVKVTSTADLTDGQYLIVYEDGSVAFNGGLETLDAVGNTIEVTISSNEIAVTEATAAAEVTIAAMEGGYSICSASGLYIYHTGTKNTLNTSEEAQANIITFNDGNVSITVGDYSMYFNSASDQQRFRYFKNAQKAIQLYKKVEATPETRTLNAQGYATFASTSAVNFDDTEITAWAVTAVSGSTITFAQVTGDIAPETGLLLKGQAGATISPETVTSGNTPAGNLLVGIVEDTPVNAYEYYGLSGQNFVKVKAGTVKAGRALLPASVVNPTSGDGEAKVFTFVFEDDATGISTVETFTEEGAIFNLAGQRLQKMQKGINIVNGKKVLK